MPWRARQRYPSDEPLLEVSETEQEELSDESPIEPWDEEDREPDDGADYLERIWSGEVGRHRRPRLALVEIGGTLRPVLENYRPLPNRYAFTALAHSLRLLRALGQLLADTIGRWPPPAAIRLQQSHAAEKLAADLNLEAGTVRSRLNRLVHHEMLELPDGRVMPLSAFFYTKGDPGAPRGGRRRDAAMDERLKAYLSNYPHLPLRQVAERFIMEHPQYQRLDRNERAKARDAVRKRLGRLEANEQADGSSG